MRLGLLLILFGSVAFARTSVDIPSGLPIDAYIERLEAYGCVRPEMRIFAPLSYADVQESLVPVGSGDDENSDCGAPEWLLTERNILTRPQRQNEARVGALGTATDSIGLLGTESRVSPLFPRRDGRTALDGGNLNLELNASAQTGKIIVLAASATPGWVGSMDTSRHFYGSFYLQEGYVKLGYRRAELTAGRMALQFGQTGHGSLLLSGASKPLNALKFDLRPHRLGSPLSWLGSFTFQAWLTSATQSAFLNRSHFVGIGLGSRPADWLELGWMELFQFSGDGAPSLDASDILRTIIYSGSDDLNFKRQRAMAFHIGTWFPSHSAKLYSQVMFESLTQPANWLSDDASVLFGLWFPKLGQGEVRLEFVHTVPVAYRNAIWTQGLSYFGSPLGHPLGPDAMGLYLDVGIPPDENWRPNIQLFYESRGKNLAPQVGLVGETRYGAGIDVTKRWAYLEFSTSLKYAYAKNHFYIANRNDSIYAALLGLSYSFF